MLIDDMIMGIDQVRSSIGIFAALFLFCYKAFPKRDMFPARILFGCFILIVQALLWLPLYEKLQENYKNYLWVGLLFIFFTSLLHVVIAYLSFEITINQLLLRTLPAGASANIVTSINRYLINLILFPELDKSNFFLYCCILIISYLLVYTAVYKTICVKMQRSTDRDILGKKRTAVAASLIGLIGYSLSYSLLQGIIEKNVRELSLNEEYVQLYYIIISLCVAVMLIISVMVILLISYLYTTSVLNTELMIIEQVKKEKELQYSFAKENIELINRKHHDLKHQLNALRYASDEEKADIIKESEETLALYDANIHTGNEVLDTILTEKSIICAGRGIRLSVIARAQGLEKIRVIDLYSLLGNAIDNAIESVEELKDEDKKTISISIINQGLMIYLTVENYYEGTIGMRGGRPVTHKKDKENHGFGVKSMEIIAKQYNGDICISTDHNIFLLQILLAP